MAFLLVGLSVSDPVPAHAFGQRYELPVPLWLYLTGAAAAVVLSFVMLARFIRKPPRAGAYPRFNLLRLRAFRALAHPACLGTLRVISVGLFVLVLLTGFYGFPVTRYNFAPAFVWIIWWVGFAYISALIGDLWALVSPWKIVFAWAERVLGWFRPGARLSLGLPYPQWLGVYPAILLFLLFAWLEHAYPDNAEPEVVAGAALLYSLMTWTGMLLFGCDRWLRSGEIFAILFSLIARISPIEMRINGSARCDECAHPENLSSHQARVGCATCFSKAPPECRELNLRPPAAGLLCDQPLSSSMTVLVILLLSILALDGFLETPLAASLFESWQASPHLASLWGHFGVGADRQGIGFTTLNLVIAPLLFLGIYLSFAGLIRRDRVPGPTGQVRNTAWHTARLFALSLMPIAVGYHLAHYLGFLLVQSQSIIPLASDPFGLEWDLFGTADYRIDIAIADARFTWYSAVLAIVGGHVVAVYLAHATAIAAYNDPRAATRSQYPMLVLMVFYTILSLWILAQPIVGF